MHSGCIEPRKNKWKMQLGVKSIADVGKVHWRRPSVKHSNEMVRDSLPIRSVGGSDLEGMPTV